MTEIEKKEDIKEIEKVEEEPRKVVFSPQMCSWTNDEGTGYDFEVYLPGVEKDTIKLKLGEETLFVVGETDTIRYVGSYTLCCPVEAEKATSSYKNGLLKIHVPFKEVELRTVDVSIE
ncbi:MAG: Hsp20/alpha crystallin family protein [Candidatus Thorarchaeota archaeon]